MKTIQNILAFLRKALRFFGALLWKVLVLTYGALVAAGKAAWAFVAETCAKKDA